MSKIKIMTKTLFALAVAFVATNAIAQTQYVRPSDPEVKALIDQVDQARDRFEGALDGKLKDSILRSATGETNVARYLDDLQKGLDQVRERFTSNYAASTEVLAFLRQCSEIDAFVLKQQGVFKGRSEWDAMAVLLSSMATTYGTSFPVPQGASARRMNDQEVALATDAAATAADQYRKTTTQAMKTAKADPKSVTAIDTELKALVAAAKALKSRLSGNKPATSEARLLLDQANKVKPLVSQPAQGAAASSWESVVTNLKKISQAFALPGL